MQAEDPSIPPDEPSGGSTRRTFIGYVLAGTTLAVGVDFSFAALRAEAAIPSVPQIPEVFDLEDLQTLSALPTSTLISIEIGTDGVGGELHPMQEAWLDRDVAQCGYCQPGQIMAAVALVKKVKAEGRSISDGDLDSIRNICRCGTYNRIREAIRQGADNM